MALLPRRLHLIPFITITITIITFCSFFTFSPSFASAAAPLRRAQEIPSSSPSATATTAATTPDATAANAAAADASADAAAAAQSTPASTLLTPLDALIKDLPKMLASPSLLGLEESFSGLLTLIFDSLKSAENGLLVPSKDGEMASQLALALQNIFSQQNNLKEQLENLQSVAAAGGLAAKEKQSLKDIGERLLHQYKELEARGMQMLQQLTELLLSFFPDLNKLYFNNTINDAIKENQQEEAFFAAAKEMFPDLLQ